MRKRGRFDVPATFPLSCPPSVLPGQGMSENPFYNPVFSFRPPEPLPTQDSGELEIEPKVGRGQGVRRMWRGGEEQEGSLEGVGLDAGEGLLRDEIYQDASLEEDRTAVQAENEENQQTKELGGESVLQEGVGQSPDSNMVEDLDKGSKKEVKAGGIFDLPGKAFGPVTTPSRSIFGYWPASQLVKPFGAVATPSSHAVGTFGIFGQPVKPGAVSTPSTELGAAPASLNFAAATNQPATYFGLFGSSPPKPKLGMSALSPISGFVGTFTAGMMRRMSNS